MAQSPMLPVACTCVPPQSSWLKPGIETTRTLLAVLLPKERHRAGRDRRLSVFDFCLHRDVPEHLFIDDLFDLPAVRPV